MSPKKVEPPAATKSREWARLTVDVSPELAVALERLAERFHGNKSDVVRRALALMEIAAQAKDEGKKFGIAEKDQPLATEIVGVV
jgi:predicted transcriptional regulator